MCGISGKLYFDRSKKVEKETIESMTRSMYHRGPDQNGIFIYHNVGLGHCRLTIIDLDSGAQPLSNEDGSMWIVFNGEIYNYRELRSYLELNGHIFKTNTDTEVILHLYEEVGEACVSKLRGMFAFAIYNKKRNSLFIARDRVGIKPLYYTVNRDRLLFASEIKALLQDQSVESVADPIGIHQFLTLTYTPGPNTVFKNIYKLQPAHFMKVEDNNITINEYWDISSFYNIHNTESIKSLETQLEDLIRESVKIHMISDVPVGFLLSGGVDSTAMLSFYRDIQQENIKTFTIGFAGQDFEDERIYARIAAKKFGVDYHETTLTANDFFDFLPQYIWYMEEPIFEPPAISLYFVSKMAREYVKVLISGEGGDEAFAGYQTYRNFLWIERIKKCLGPARKGIADFLYSSGKKLEINRISKYAPMFNIPLDEYYYSRASNPTNFFNTNFENIYTSDFSHYVFLESGSLPFKNLFKKMAGQSSLSKMLYTDINTWLPDRLLLKADKMTMANSIELRVPLLDHKVLEFTASLPDNQKIRGITTKYIFKKILTGRIPNDIIKRKKAGFPTPYAYWFFKNKGKVLDVLMDQQTLERGYFEKNKLQKMLIDKWVKTGQYSTEIFNLLTLELWHRCFIRNSKLVNNVSDSVHHTVSTNRNITPNNI